MDKKIGESNNKDIQNILTKITDLEKIIKNNNNNLKKYTTQIDKFVNLSDNIMSDINKNINILENDMTNNLKDFSAVNNSKIMKVTDDYYTLSDYVYFIEKNFDSLFKNISDIDSVISDNNYGKKNVNEVTWKSYKNEIDNKISYYKSNLKNYMSSITNIETYSL